MHMKVLAPFDGISCGMVALERAGIKADAYYASEIDDNAIAISAKNHNGIAQLGDVTKWKEWDIPWKDIDLIMAGSPCQGFSRAGKCLNFNDPRSRLFFVFVDILNAVREVNPDVKFLLENVKMKNEWRDVISERLGFLPIEINSKCMSAQNRHRTYWTNIDVPTLPDGQGPKLLDILEDGIDTTSFIEHAGLLFDPTISEQSRDLVYRVGKEIRVKQAVRQGYIVAKNGDGINLSFPTSKSRRGRVIDQKSATLDCACDICVLQNNIVRRFTTRELERLQTLPDGYTDGFPAGVARKAIGNGWTVDVIAYILKHIGDEKNENHVR